MARFDAQCKDSTMRKLVALLSVVVALGVAFVGYRLWRAGEQVSQAVTRVEASGGTRDPIAAPVPAPRPAAIDVGTAEVTRPDAAPLPPPLPGEEVPDQFGPDGHDANRQARRVGQDLGGTPATPSSDPIDTRTPEAAALAEAQATLEALLDDPDPAVREQAAALLEVVAAESQ